MQRSGAESRASVVFFREGFTYNCDAPAHTPSLKSPTNVSSRSFLGEATTPQQDPRGSKIITQNSQKFGDSSSVHIQ